MIQLYKNIKERRVQIGMSQDELAKKVILEYSASFWTDKKITINLK